jgi:hypothetical protein
MIDTAGPEPLAHCRVLVVDDEYFLADDMARALKGLGGEVGGLRRRRIARSPCLRPNRWTWRCSTSP